MLEIVANGGLLPNIGDLARRVHRVHAELRLGQDVRCSRKRVERLMRQAGIAGIHRRRSEPTARSATSM